MQMPIVVGVIMAVMALVTFSGWFYEYATGMGELVLDDQFFNYRIALAVILSMVFAVVAFFVIATINECPNENREGAFAGLKCESYLRIKASADQVFKPKEKTVDETL